MLVAGLLLFGPMLTAQNRKISGKVTDDSGTPVPFATITVKSTKQGVAADASGNFSLSAKTGDVLVVSATGFDPIEMKVGTEDDVSIKLGRKATVIDEVIVTAQGIRKRPRELGYSVGKVNTEEITVGRSPQLAQSLSGKVSGLAIYNVDNSVDPQVKVVLRGYRSLTGNNDALVVVDGIPNASQSVLALLNPNDIESVTVLKGGQAATLYGSAGVNGAIVVTTKKGKKGKLKAAFSTAVNFEKLSWLPDFQSEYGNGSHYTAGYGTAGWHADYKQRMAENWRPFENQQYGDPYNGEMRIIGRVLEDGSKQIIPYSALSGEREKAWNTGHTLNNQVSFSGGDDNSTYYLSLENNKSEGVVPHDESSRTSVRLAATKEADKLKAGFNIAYVQANYDRTTSDFYFDAINVASHIPISTYKDWQHNKFANPNGFYDDYYNNPYFNADNNRQKYMDANITGNVELNYQLLPWMNLFNRIGVISNSRTRKNTTGKFIYTDWAKNDAYVPAPWDWANDYDGIDRAGTDILGGVLDRITNENVINNEFQVQMSKDFKEFSNKFILGYSVYQRKTKQTEVSSGSIVQEGVFNVANRQGELGGGESNTTERKFGYYADLTTGWRDILYVHGSFRYDATSRFYKNYRDASLYSYPYYGVDASFVLTDAFPKLQSDIFNYAKIRAGFNKNGNDNIDLYGLDLQFPNGAGFPYGSTVGFTVGDILPDANLKPEFVYSYEVGGEFQFWKNRISLELTAYTQNSKGQVLTVKVPNTTGFPNLRINVGETKNWGYETDLRVQVIKQPKFNWEISARYSYNNNKVEKLFNGVDEFAYGGYSYAQTYVIKGQSYPSMKATAYVRDPVTNRVVVNSASGYPLTAATPKNFGRTIPPHMAGAGTRIRYADFTLAANFEYRGGNVIFHQLGRDMTFTGSGGWTSNRTPHIFPNSAIDDGTNTGKYVVNDKVQVREAEYSLWVDYYRLIAENFVTPGWFIKMRDINLTYNLPGKLIAKTKFISAANVAIYGRNLFTIVDKANMFTDPEFSYTTGNGLGINNTGQTPPVRQYGINLNLTF